jgi:hypothetical protein
MSRRIRACLLAAVLLSASGSCLALPVSARGGGGRLGIGLMAGAPSGLTLKYWMNSVNALNLVIGGWSYYSGDYYAGPHFSLDYLWHSYRPFDSGPDGGRMPVYAGLGVQIASPDFSALRVPLGVTYLFNAPFDVFAEVSPTFLFGPRAAVGVGVGIGGRFYF